MALADTAQLAVKLSLDDRSFSGPLKRVQSNLGGLNKSFGRIGSGVGKLGTGLFKVGAIAVTAAGAGLVAATKVALDFQDAMAGVSKTVEGTPDQIAAIGRQLLDLSTQIPVGATELAGIAQELGALGVPRDDIAQTAKVVAELAAATVGLTTEAAAEAFGKLGNVLKVHGPDVERFGSSLVALGNAGASSEGDIITVATRFGAAGSEAKLSAAQVLGFSSAIASLGVQPEAAGSSLSRLFNNVTKYIGTGDKKIKAFAQVAGVSVKQFSHLFAKDASGAMQLFLQKLGGLDRFKASKALKEAGITNIRDINAVLLLSQNYGILKTQLDLSTQAWADNTALQETAAKRFSSVQAKLTEFWNTIKRAAIVMGNEFLPALGRSIDRLKALLSLPSTDNDLKNLGQDIARFLDNIDWNQVVDGAKTFLGYVRDIAGLLSHVPVQISAAVAAFAGLNKLSGGLIGAGVGDIVGGVLGAGARGLAAKTPVLGALFAQPVFVTNWPGSLGSGLGGAGAAAGGGMGLLKGGLILTAVAAAEVAAAGEFGKWLRTQVTGSDAPLTSDHVIANLGPVEIGLFQSQAQSLHNLVTLQRLQAPHKAQDDQENAAHMRNIVQAPSKGTAQLQKIQGSLENQRHQMLAKFQSGITTTDTRTKGAVSSGSGAIVSAIRANRPVVSVSVRVSTTSVHITKNYQSGSIVGSGISGGRDLNT